MNKIIILIVALFFLVYQLSAIHQKFNDTQLIYNFIEVEMISDSLILEILDNKCNACHLKKKWVVITIGNMSTYTQLIKEKVIIKQSMPKGKNNQLTDSQKRIIQRWTFTGEQ